MSVVVTSETDLKRLISTSVRAAVEKEKGEPEEPSTPKEWLTNREAQAFLGLSKPTLQRYRNSGRLSYSKIGGRVYYRRADIVRLLEDNLNQGTSSQDRSS